MFVYFLQSELQFQQQLQCSAWQLAGSEEATATAMIATTSFFIYYKMNLRLITQTNSTVRAKKAFVC